MQFVLAFLYAPESAMGLEEEMTCIWDGRKTTQPQYIMAVRSGASPHTIKRYQTIRLISGVGAEAIRGRGTRVWEVKEVKKGKLVGKPRVLKDSWIDSDRPREGVVIKSIFDDAAHLQKAKDRDLLRKSLLKPIIAGDVWVGDDVDSTIDGRQRTRWIDNPSSKFRLLRPAMTYNTDSSTSAESTPPPAGPSRVPAGDHRGPADHDEVAEEPIVYRSKTHYRIVFFEVCEVLHEIKSLPDILYTLCKVCEGEFYHVPMVAMTNSQLNSAQAVSSTWVGAPRYQLREYSGSWRPR